jgi:protocatechuate 3,4-dioxygenase beta subunit
LVIERQAAPLPTSLAGDAVVAVTVLGPAHEGEGSLSPVAGARVTVIAIVDGGAYLAASNQTDATGLARLAHIPVGEAWLLVDAPGFGRASTHAVLARAERLFTVALVPEHVLEVVVRDDQGAPLVGADIEVQGADPLPVGARTDTKGIAEVRRLTESPWIVTARAAGYESLTHRGVREHELLSIALRRLGEIQVAVLGQAGEPAAATVVLVGGNLWPARTVDTDSQGRATIASLPSGSYALRATSGETVSPIELGVALGKGERKEVVLQLMAGRFVSARVTDGEAPDASAVPGARVSLTETGLSPFPFEGTSDREGRIRLGPIAPGPAFLSARAEGFVLRGLVSVPEGGGTIQVVLVHAAKLSGRVVDARGFPVGGASIEIIGNDAMGSPIDDDPRRVELQEAHFDSALAPPRPLVPAGDLGVVPGAVPAIPHGFFRAPFSSLPGRSLIEPWVTRDDGTFRATPVTPGRVRALVRHPLFVEGVSDAVTITPGEEAEVRIVLRPGGTLEGRVLDFRGQPVSRARVTVSAARGSLEKTTLTATDGTFAFASLPEAVTLTAFAGEAPPELSTHAAVTVPESGTQNVVLTLPQPRAALIARVKDDRGYPLEAVQVGVTSLDPVHPLRTTVFTDGRGEAKIAGGGGLDLRIEARLPGHATRITRIDAGTESIDIVLDTAETLRGEVTSLRGESVADAEVAVITHVGVDRARTNRAGVFVVPDLMAGKASIVVQAPGFAFSKRDVEIVPSSSHRTILPTIELSAECVVEGTVVDGRGDPVPGARVAKDRVGTYLPQGPLPLEIALTDSRGRFRLGGLTPGILQLEAYAPDIGRAMMEGVAVGPSRPTVGLQIRLQREGDEFTREAATSGGVAVTLGETGDDPREIVLVDVARGSEAERSGLMVGDALLSVDGAPVHTIADARRGLAGPLVDDVVLEFRRGEIVDAVRVARERVRK